MYTGGKWGICPPVKNLFYLFSYLDLYQKNKFCYFEDRINTFFYIFAPVCELYVRNFKKPPSGIPHKTYQKNFTSHFFTDCPTQIF